MKHKILDEIKNWNWIEFSIKLSFVYILCQVLS